MGNSPQAVQTIKTGVQTVGIITPQDRKLMSQPDQERTREIKNAKRGLQPSYQGQRDIGGVLNTIA